MSKWVLLFLFLPFFLLAEPAECKAYFSSQDQLAGKLIELIDREPKSIKIAVFYLTHTGIAKSLVRAQERGVAVEVIIDPGSIKTKSAIHRLVEAKIPLFVWDQSLRAGSKKSEKGGKAKMHDKFCILGDSLTWTGSFNFTHAADTHHEENAVTVESREIAQKYQYHFAELKLYGSRPYQEYVALHPKQKKAKKVR